MNKPENQSELELLQNQFSDAANQYPGLECYILCWNPSHTQVHFDAQFIKLQILGRPDTLYLPPFELDSVIYHDKLTELDGNELDEINNYCERTGSWLSTMWLIGTKGWDAGSALSKLRTLSLRAAQSLRCWDPKLSKALEEVVKDVEAYLQACQATSGWERGGALNNFIYNEPEFFFWIWSLFLSAKIRTMFVFLGSGNNLEDLSVCGTYQELIPRCRENHEPYFMQMDDVFLESALLCRLLSQTAGPAKTRQEEKGEQASGVETKKHKKKLKPLSEKAAAVLELLKTVPEHRGMTGPRILEALDKKNILIDQSTLTKNIIPQLKPYGVKNRPRIGYYIEQ